MESNTTDLRASYKRSYLFYLFRRTVSISASRDRHVSACTAGNGFLLLGISLGTTLAMSEGREVTGWTSAFVGATGFLCGGIVTPMVGMGNIRQSTCIALLSCAFFTLIVAYFTPANHIEPACRR